MAIQFIRGSFTWDLNINGGGYAAISVFVTGAVNWGIAPITRITQRGPFQDGDTDIDYRINPRVINLPVVVPSATYEAMMANRESLIQMFKPGNDTATLKHINEDPLNYNTRSIDVKIAGATMDSSQMDFNVRAVIQLRAADPTWYDVTQKYIQLTSTVLGTPTPYPKTYPVPYGEYGAANITPVIYTGTVVGRPILQCVGPFTDLVIADGGGHLIAFDDPIPDGDTWTVDLRPGRKTVVDQNGVNRFPALTITTDLINWGIYPQPTFPDGLQYFSVSATGTTATSAVNMYWNDRFVGI